VRSVKLSPRAAALASTRHLGPMCSPLTISLHVGERMRAHGDVVAGRRRRVQRGTLCKPRALHVRARRRDGDKVASLAATAPSDAVAQIADLVRTRAVPNAPAALRACAAVTGVVLGCAAQARPLLGERRVRTADRSLAFVQWIEALLGQAAQRGREDGRGAGGRRRFPPAIGPQRACSET